MKSRDRIILWPVYFDSTRTRSEGRKVPRRLAVPNPQVTDVLTALERLNLKGEVVQDAAHPRSPWRRIGYIVIQKNDSKNRILKRVAEELCKLQIHRGK